MIVILVAVVAGILLLTGKPAGKAVSIASIDCSTGTHTATIPKVIPISERPTSAICSRLALSATTNCGIIGGHARCILDGSSIKDANSMCTFKYTCSNLVRV